MRRGLFVTLAASLTLGLAASADAYKVGGKRWPGKRTVRIGYQNVAPQWKDAVRSAVRAWNASGARVKFVTAPRRRARLQVRYMTGGEQPVAHGEASLGFFDARWSPWRKPYNFVWLPRLNVRYPAYNVRKMQNIAAHEMGHVIGLAHEDRRCSVMNLVPYTRCAPPPDDRYQRCQLLTRDDVAGAVRRYGGRSRLRGPGFCLIPMASPTLLGSSFDSVNHVARVRLRSPYSRRLAFQAWAIGAANGGCPASPDDPDFASTDATEGEEFEILLSRRSRGRYCVRVWSGDNKGVLSDDPPTTAFVDIPSDPPQPRPEPDEEEF